MYLLTVGVTLVFFLVLALGFVAKRARCLMGVMSIQSLQEEKGR